MEETRGATIKMRRTTSKDRSLKPSLPKNPMSNGKMYPDYKMQKMHSKRQLSSPLNFLKFLQAVASLGKGSFFMVHLGLGKHI